MGKLAAGVLRTRDSDHSSAGSHAEPSTYTSHRAEATVDRRSCDSSESHDSEIIGSCHRGGFSKLATGGGMKMPPGGPYCCFLDPCEDLAAYLLEKSESTLELLQYGRLVGQYPPNWIGANNHHINQPGVMGIDRIGGIAVPLPGNPILNPNSPHGKLHKSIDDQFDEFRKRGQNPTFDDYNQMIRKGFQDAGCDPALGDIFAEFAKAEYEARGFRGNQTFDPPRRVTRRSRPNE